MSLRKKIAGMSLAAAIAMTAFTVTASADYYVNNGVYYSTNQFNTGNNGYYYYVNSSNQVVNIGTTIPTNFNYLGTSLTSNGNGNYTYRYLYRNTTTGYTNVGTSTTSYYNGYNYNTNGNYSISGAIRDDDPNADLSIRTGVTFYESKTGRYYRYILRGVGTNSYTKEYLNYNNSYYNTMSDVYYYDSSTGKYYYMIYDNARNSYVKTYINSSIGTYYNNGTSLYDTVLGQYYYYQLNSDGSYSKIYTGNNYAFNYKANQVSNRGNYYEKSTGRYYYYKLNISSGTYTKTYYNAGYIPLNYSTVDPYLATNNTSSTVTTSSNYNGTKILYKYGLRYVSNNDATVNNIINTLGTKKVMILNSVSSSKNYFLGKNNAGYTLYLYKYENGKFKFIEAPVVSAAGYIRTSYSGSGIYVATSSKIKSSLVAQ